MKDTFVIIGAKWFDKVNGNTYCNAKIINVNNNEVGYIGYQYGYGHHYFDEAVKIYRPIYPDANFIDGGCFEVKKTVLKNNFF